MRAIRYFYYGIISSDFSQMIRFVLFQKYQNIPSSLSIIKLKFVILIGAQRSEESPFEWWDSSLSLQSDKHYIQAWQTTSLLNQKF